MPSKPGRTDQPTNVPIYQYTNLLLYLLCASIHRLDGRYSVLGQH